MSERRIHAIAVVALLVCMRDGSALADAPAGRYSALDCSGIACVKDNLTGLTWKKDEESKSFTWADAKLQCISPWRLPTIRELQSIVDVRKELPPRIDTAYFNTVGIRVWSSTKSAKDSTKAWRLDFGFGDSNEFTATSTYRVRCVR